MKTIQQISTWFSKQRRVTKIAIGCSSLSALCCLCSFPIAFLSSPISTLDVRSTSVIALTLTPENTQVVETASIPAIALTMVSTNNPTVAPAEQPSPAISQLACTPLRFGEQLGPDTIDELIGEGNEFRNVSEIAVRFDCSNTSSDQITWEWKRDGELHCTNTFQSKECDQSMLISWDTSPGRFLITLFSKGGYLLNLQPGTYELIVYLSGSKAASGTIVIEE